MNQINDEHIYVWGRRRVLNPARVFLEIHPFWVGPTSPMMNQIYDEYIVFSTSAPYGKHGKYWCRPTQLKRRRKAKWRCKSTYQTPKRPPTRMFELPLNGSVNLLHLQLIFETNRSFPLLMEGLWQPSREQEGSNAFQLSHLQKTLASILLFIILSVLIFSSSILFVVCCQVCFSTFT